MKLIFINWFDITIAFFFFVVNFFHFLCNILMMDRLTKRKKLFMIITLV